MKQLMNWTKKKKLRLEKFWEIEQRDGSVTMKQIAEVFNEKEATVYLWRTYCIENNLIESCCRGQYTITEFGREILGGE